MNYYSLDKVISYNIPVNVIITERGYGKSFSVKKYVIDQYLKKHNSFIYIRRYENELKSVFEGGSPENPKDFFDDLKEKFPEHNLKAKNRKFYCDGEVFRIRKKDDWSTGS